MWLRWLGLLVFVAVLGFTFVRLGEWQLHRLEGRQAQNATILANESAPPKPFEAVFNRTITDADQWQRVTVTGTFDADHQFQVRYRPNGSDSGYEVVTPLQTDTGQWLLVDRGHVTVPGGQKIPETLPPPPAGEVTVTGHVRRSENGKPAAIDPVNNQVRLVNAAAIGRTLPYPVVDGYLAALEMDPPQGGEFKPLELPEISDGPHFWYAMQWFLFALIGLTGLGVFIRGDIVERRRRRALEADSSAGSTRVDGEPGGSAAATKGSGEQVGVPEKK